MWRRGHHVGIDDAAELFVVVREEFEEVLVATEVVGSEREGGFGVPRCWRRQRKLRLAAPG